MLPFKNRNYFTLDNLDKIWTYHVKVCRQVFLLGYNIFQKQGYFSPKIVGGKKLSKSVFGDFKTKKKKVPMAISDLATSG